MLDHLRLDAGAVAPRLAPVPLGPLIARVGEMNEPAARLAGVDLRVTPNRHVALADPDLLERIVGNLVANALRHTPSRAGVTVRVGRLTGPPAAAPRVRSGPAVVAPGVPLAVLEVSDDGPGVPAAHAARVFERLYRADSSRTRGNGGGSGLGLSIVAAIVHGHGGWVELDSPPGGGATFRVILPLIAGPGH